MIAAINRTDNVDISYLFSVEFENKCLRCVETKRIYKDAKEACKDFGLSYYRMKRHLDGIVPRLKFKHFEYSNAILDEEGRIIKGDD